MTEGECEMLTCQHLFSKKRKNRAKIVKNRLKTVIFAQKHQICPKLYTCIQSTVNPNRLRCKLITSRISRVAEDVDPYGFPHGVRIYRFSTNASPAMLITSRIARIITLHKVKFITPSRARLITARRNAPRPLRLVETNRRY